MVGIPPIKMVMNGGWFMALLYQHEISCTNIVLYPTLDCLLHQIHQTLDFIIAIPTFVKFTTTVSPRISPTFASQLGDGRSTLLRPLRGCHRVPHRNVPRGTAAACRLDNGRVMVSTYHSEKI